MSLDLIIHSANQLLTLAGDAPKRGATQGELSIIRDGAVAISGEKIVAVGDTLDILSLADSHTRKIDARGKIVLPGFVDAHTHVVFAGDRANEFEMRLQGATYLDIQQAGGGIMSTVRATRAASIEELVAQSRTRLDAMLAHGTTTAEVKTGYGLDTANEIKMLDAIARLDTDHAIDLIPTFLGAHVVPAEFKGREDEYVDLVVNEMLPQSSTRRSEDRVTSLSRTSDPSILRRFLLRCFLRRGRIHAGTNTPHLDARQRTGVRLARPRRRICESRRGDAGGGTRRGKRGSFDGHAARRNARDGKSEYSCGAFAGDDIRLGENKFRGWARIR